MSEIVDTPAGLLLVGGFLLAFAAWIVLACWAWGAWHDFCRWLTRKFEPVRLKRGDAWPSTPRRDDQTRPAGGAGSGDTARGPVCDLGAGVRRRVNGYPWR